MISEELKRALARPDVGTLIRRIDAYVLWCSHESNNPAPEPSDDFEDILSCYRDDPDKALAYVVIGASRSDDAYFLSLLGCGTLEDLLRDPSAELLARIVAEARRSARFRWLLSHPFKVAVAERAWTLIQDFRVSGPHEEPSYETLPPRDGASP